MYFYEIFNANYALIPNKKCSCNKATGTVAPPGSTAFSTSWKDNLPTGQKIIPVVVHLLGVANGLSNAQVQTALNLLNSDFNSANLDWDIEFRLAKFDPDGRCTDGITHLSTVKWPNKSYLNIWVVDIVNGDPNNLGVVSVRPSLFQEINGVIMRNDRVAGQNFAFDEQDGVTVKAGTFYPNSGNLHAFTHEVGHWLNLLHTFSPCGDMSGPFNFWTCCHPTSEGTVNGDFIQDTP